MGFYSLVYECKVLLQADAELELLQYCKKIIITRPRPIWILGADAIIDVEE